MWLAGVLAEKMAARVVLLVVYDAPVREAVISDLPLRQARSPPTRFFN
jgi:hypothetical protein